MKPSFRIILLLLAVLGGQRCIADPFAVSAEINSSKSGQRQLSVMLSVPTGYYLYADSIKVSISGGTTLAPSAIPRSKREHDAFADADVDIYDHDVTFTFILPDDNPPPADIEVTYRGCSQTMCFLPETRKITVGHHASVAGKSVEPAKEMVPTTEPIAAAADWRVLVQRFTVAGSAAGYLGPKQFIKFLDDAVAGRGMERDRLRSTFEEKGAGLAALLILVGGLLLNFTPCVLPMIPVNIAIIGAGSRAGSRGRGFILGGVYGLGIAIVYGALGLAVILSGSRFGALNSSPWFNLIVAAVFALMALATFGVFNVDFSRFQANVPQNRPSGGGFLVAFVMGGFSAILAGACVAPAVISVLLLSADLYSRGDSIGLALPFLLGVGMALPWPFAGAGLSFLPKPGKWMEKVKYGFGVVILLLAAWYGKEGYSLLRDRFESKKVEVAEIQRGKTEEGWLNSFEEALLLADKEKKLVFVDFWASWCKNCLVMDRTTFRDPDALKRLEGFVKVKYRAEDPAAPAVKEVLDHFHVIGLPTYLVLRPGEPPEGGKYPIEERKKGERRKREQGDR